LINLPNGPTIFANYSGLVKFFDKCYLLDVLYVPQFKLNLISTSKLSLQLKCTLTFISTHCIIQGNLSHEKIDIVKATTGLYLFNVFSIVSHTTPQIYVPYINCNIKDKHMWHCRMGYPSHERLTVLSAQYHFITIDKLHLCDTYNCAKQKKMPFSLSTTTITVIFYIVHFLYMGTLFCYFYARF